MIATNMQVPAVRSRATHAPMVADPYLADALASATALSLDLSTTGLKHLERAGGISKSRASRWSREGRGNPLFDVTMVTYRLMQAGQHAGAIAAHVLTTLAQSLMPQSPAELVARFFTLMREESQREGRENEAQAAYAETGDLEALERATLAEAGIQHKLGAVCRELRRRKIDPRTFI